MKNAQSTDPVANLGRQIAELEARYEKLEELEDCARESNNQSEEFYYQAAREDVHSRIETLKEALSCYEAQSLAGAMVQAGLIYNLIDELAAGEQEDVAALKERAERLAMSVIRAIEREVGTGLDALGLSALRSSHVDPWEPVENRLALVQARRSSNEKAA